MKKFWIAALIRAIRTMAETALAYIGTAALLDEVNWLGVLSAAAMGGIISVLMAIATGLPEADALVGSGNSEDRRDKPKG